MISSSQQTAVTDFGALAKLRADARTGENPADNLDEVARQFESLFIHMVLKQMRQASMGEGLFDSPQSKSYTEMYDQQLSANMAESGGMGLAPAIKRQLGGEPLIPDVGRSHADYLASPTARAPALNPAVASQQPNFADPADFVRRLRPHAEAAASRLGIKPEALLAQAALETGWGKSVMKTRDGGQSHNLFGIKADSRWEGDRASVRTLEYRDGVAMKTRADFRAYDSYADSFADYANFVTDNPRYKQALEAVDDPQAYFQALQKAGYATDPAYARKVVDLLDRPEFQTRQTAATAQSVKG